VAGVAGDLSRNMKNVPEKGTIENMTTRQLETQGDERPRRQRWLLRLEPLTWRVLVGLAFCMTLLAIFGPATAQAKGVQTYARTVPSVNVVRGRAATTNAYMRPTDCQPGKNNDTIVTCAQNIDPLSSKQVGILASPIGQNGSIFYYTPLDTTSNYGVKTIWQILLACSDAFILLIIGLKAAQLMLAGTVFRYANVVEELPKMLLALLSAHLSWDFVQVILGMNNAMSVGLASRFAYVGSLGHGSGVYQNCDQGIFNTGIWVSCVGQLFGPAAPHDLLQDVPMVPTNLNMPNIGDALSSMGNLTGLILKILGMMLLAQVMIRLFLLALYAATSGAALACGMLGKAGAPMVRLWTHGFLSTAMVQFLQVTAWLLVVGTVGPILRHMHDGLGSTVDLQTLANMMGIGVDWFILQIPSLMGTASMRTLAQAGQAMGQAAGAALAVSVVEVQSVATAGVGVAGVMIAR
jgi:hypothetical protein